MLKSGSITSHDIEGNVQADLLAERGADGHRNIDSIITEMHDKRQLTIVVQKMILEIWESFIDDDKDCREANQDDIDEMERMLHNAQF